jgi:hypothetical protein
MLVLSLEIILVIASFLVELIFQIAEIKILEDSSVGTTEAYRKSFALFYPCLIACILTGIAILFGGILLIIPGIIFGVRFFFSLWVVVCEGKQGKTALMRSKAYTKGVFWAVFMRISIFVLLTIGGIMFMDKLQTFVLNSTPYGYIWGIPYSKVGMILVHMLYTLLVPPFLFVYLYQIYIELKARYEDQRQNTL